MGWRDRVRGSYLEFRWWCPGEGSGGGGGCVVHGVWLHGSGGGGHRCDVRVVVRIVIGGGWRGAFEFVASCPPGKGKGAGDGSVGLWIRIVEFVNVGVIVIEDGSGVDVDWKMAGHRWR